jgi:hypothetical protein
MGVSVAVVAFDENRFREVVVPAFRAGENHPVIVRAVDRLRARRMPVRPGEYQFDGLAKFMTYIEFTMNGFRLHDSVVDWFVVKQVEEMSGWHYPWEGPAWGRPELAQLVEWVVLREAAAGYVDLGTFRYLSQLFPDGWLPEWNYRDTPAEDLDLLSLLLRLTWHPDGDWTYDGGAGRSGITGWLDSVRTLYFADVLPRHLVVPDPDKGWWGSFQLRQLIAIDDWAAERELGLFWGYDIDLTWRPERYWHEDESPIVELLPR